MAQQWSVLKALATTVLYAAVGFTVFLFVLSLGVMPAHADPGILYVAPDGNCGGVSPCYGNIQEAVDAASANDEIRVASGTYTGVSSRDGMTQVVYISKTVTLRGGYAIADWTGSDPTKNPTVLDAERQGRGITIIGAISPTVQGLHITGGMANSGGFGNSSGGIHVVEAVAAIRDNVIYDNIAAEYAGGISISYAPDFEVRDNVIISNAAIYAGGVDIWISKGTLLNNVIIRNTADYSSGFLASNSTVRLLHNTIAENTGGDGVGVSIENAPFGEVRYSIAYITNTILVSQTVGISITQGNTVTVDSILWHNTPITITGLDAATVAVQNEHWGDPEFAPDGFHITEASSAKDTGIDAGVTTDIDNHYRPYATAPDLGADELIAVSIAPAASSSLVYTDAKDSPTVIGVPAGAVTDTTTLVFTPVEETETPGGFVLLGQAFELDAYQSGALVPGFTFNEPISLTIHYAASNVIGIDQSTLRIDFWNEDSTQWEDAATTCTPPTTYDRHSDKNWLSVQVCHLSRFGLFGKLQSNQVYMPFVVGK